MAEKNNAERMRWVREREKKYAGELLAEIPARYTGKDREEGDERGYKFSPSTMVMIAAKEYIVAQKEKLDEVEIGAENSKKKLGTCCECKGSGRIGGIGVPPNGSSVHPTHNGQVLELYALAHRVMQIAALKAMKNRGVPSKQLEDALDTANTFLKELGDAIEEL